MIFKNRELNRELICAYQGAVAEAHDVGKRGLSKRPASRS
jgi:hypothetical protein